MAVNMFMGSRLQLQYGATLEQASRDFIFLTVWRSFYINSNANATDLGGGLGMVLSHKICRVMVSGPG